VSFKIGEKLVYPNHGVGVVESIRQAGSEEATPSCYEVRLLGSNSRLTVPVDNSERVGLRPLVPQRDLVSVFQVLEDGTFVPATDWKGRFKQNLDKMKSGRLTDVADVLKSLNWVQKQKALSFREKKMYERARYLVVSEIAHVNGVAESEAEREVERALDQSVACKRTSPALRR
jgi:CarD family transcriptional regulator